MEKFEIINGAFEVTVPNYGPAKTKGGEIIRAFVRIAYRYYNDGDIIGIGYGKQTCNPAARFLGTECMARVGGLIWRMWGDEYKYESQLEELGRAIVEELDEHEEYFRMPTKDMWDYTDKDEDVDDYEEDEEWDWEAEEDEWDEWDWKDEEDEEW